MMIRRLFPSIPSRIPAQVRSQGTAISRHVGQISQINQNSEPQSPPINPFKPSHYHSTIYHGESKDFTSLTLERDESDVHFEAHADAMLRAWNSYQSNGSSGVAPRHENQVNQVLIDNEHIANEVVRDVPDVPAPPMGALATATDMDLIEAAYANHDHESFDKILILMRHGEAKHEAFEREWVKTGRCVEEANEDEKYPADSMLTGKGCGQMQSLARRTATFFNNETTLHPELFVVSPLSRAIQSAIIAFPTQTPMASLKNTPWISLPFCKEDNISGKKSEMVRSRKELEGMFPGVDFDRIEKDAERLEDGELGDVPLFESKIDLMRRTDEFLKWVQNRKERVIVVSSHATWFHSLCAFSLQYEPDSKGLEMFKKGELRPVGIKFH